MTSRDIATVFENFRIRRVYDEAAERSGQSAISMRARWLTKAALQEKRADDE